MYALLGRGVMVLREYDGLTSTQKWIRDGDTIRNMVDKDSVLDITVRKYDYLYSVQHKW